MKKTIVVLLTCLIVYQWYVSRTPALTQSISLKEVSVHQGDLVLINKQTKIQQDPRNLSAVAKQVSETIVEPDVLLEDHVATALHRMIQRAKKVGIDHFRINSAY
ncbi:MAG: hypothetical protein WAL00_11700, partial [Exiguobacterium undae]